MEVLDESAETALAGTVRRLGKNGPALKWADGAASA